MNLLLSCLIFPLSTMENVFADKIMKHELLAKVCYLSFDKDVRHFKDEISC